MGLFEMSLINKMLQDLEERHFQGEASGTMHGQLRAVPQNNRIHAAWWVVLVLALMLTGVGAWLWGHQTAPAQTAPAVATEQPNAKPNAQQPQLVLKLAPDLSVTQPPALKNPVEEKNGVLPAAAAASSSATKEGGVAIAADKPIAAVAPGSIAIAPVPPASARIPAAVAAVAPEPAPAPISPAPVSELAPAPVPPAPARMATATKGKARTEPATQKMSDFGIPANVTKQVKQLTPQQRAENEYRRATGLIQQARIAESIGALQQVLQLDPYHAVARQTLVGLLLETKRLDDAIRRLQEGVNLDRSQPALAMMLARLQVEKGRLQPAVETLQGTLPYAAERADYQAFLAALFQRQARHKEAVEHYQVALSKSPQSGIWWMGLAISLQAENRLAEARDAFGRAKAADTLSPELLAFVEQKLNQLR
jgi:MSHA biogenesis protein MshN